MGNLLDSSATLKRPCIAEGRTFQWQLKQGSFQVSLNTNVYCDGLEEISDLKIFLNASAGHCKRCGRPHVARGPLFPNPDFVHFLKNVV